MAVDYSNGNLYLLFPRVVVRRNNYELLHTRIYSSNMRNRERYGRANPSFEGRPSCTEPFICRQTPNQWQRRAPLWILLIPFHEGTASRFDRICRSFSCGQIDPEKSTSRASQLLSDSIRIIGGRNSLKFYISKV